MNGSPSFAAPRLVIVFVIFVCFGAAGHSDPILLFADALFEAGDYEGAITEYKRYLFLHQGDDCTEGAPISSAYSRIATALRNQSLWEDSLRAFERSILCASTAEERRQRQLDLVITLIAAGKYNRAEFELAKMKADVEASDRKASGREESIGVSLTSESFRRRLDYYSGVIHVLNHRWEEAEQILSGVFQEGGTLNAAEQREWREIRNLLKEAGQKKEKSPRLARGLSFFLPGAGQIYAGDFRSGVGALAVNAASIGLLVFTLIDRRYLESALVFLYLIHRYYRGNLYNAERLAMEYNREQNNSYAAEILQHLASIAVPDA